MSDTPTMSSSPADTQSEAQPLRRIGLVVHPSRSVDRPLSLVREWSEEHGVELTQVPAAYSQRRVAGEGDPGDAELIVSIGGDGTTLAALRSAAMARRPVLGIACGSLGALATVAVPDVTRSLERFRRGEWQPRRFPALSVTRADGEPLFALNDVAVVRAGGGQVRVSARVDGSLYARIAGDGALVSTPIGSSGYTISAGGPLLAGGLDGFVFTPLPKHGGFAPPLVIPAQSVLELEVGAGFGGARLEVDGQVMADRAHSLSIRWREDAATMVGFPDQETLPAGLRRRRIIVDSPRVAADVDSESTCPE
ncbi:MAG TPA: NAD(+)/NADH kinase [Solirubrobacteraceae bacterium]|nr:NAD(+)/NADH kinase [Solirubrobacteraceae bacterium]